MTNEPWFLAGLFSMVMVMAGCGAGAGARDLAEEEGGLSALEGGEARAGAGGESSRWTAPRATMPSEHRIPLIPSVLTFTNTDELALVNGASGAIHQILATARLGGERDLIYDPWQARAVVFEGGAGVSSGEIATYAIDGGPLRLHVKPRLHECWVEGDVRLLSSPLGIVVFEQGDGERWKVLYSDEESSASVAAPLPASAWITTSGWNFSIHALTYGEAGQLIRRTADVQWKWIGSPAASGLNVPSSTAPPNTRLLPAPARGGAMLFDVTGSDVEVRLVHGPYALPEAQVPLGASGLRIEDAIAIDGGAVVLLLMSGDSRVLAIETDAAGAVTSTAAVSLPGAVRVEPRFFSHDLAALGSRRALAATSAGVFSIRIHRGAGRVHLSLDDDFDGASLRGPIAPL
jgi:hypothetical protein